MRHWDGGRCYNISALHLTLRLILSSNLNLALTSAPHRPLTGARRDTFEEEQEELDRQRLTHKVGAYLDVATVASTRQSPIDTPSPVSNLSDSRPHGPMQQHGETQKFRRVSNSFPGSTSSFVATLLGVHTRVPLLSMYSVYNKCDTRPL